MGTPAGSWEIWVPAPDFHFPGLGFEFSRQVGFDFQSEVSDTMTLSVEGHFLGTWDFPSVLGVGFCVLGGVKESAQKCDPHVFGNEL